MLSTSIVCSDQPVYDDVETIDQAATVPSGFTDQAVVSGLSNPTLMQFAPDGRHLRHAFAPSLPQDYNHAVDGLEIGPTAGSCGAAAALGQRVVVADVTTHPNWEPYRSLAARANIRACWSQPIRAADGAILGTFAMYYSEPRGPEPYEERFIEAMAHMAGIAIERARMEVER